MENQQKGTNEDRALVKGCIRNDRTAQANFYRKYAPVALKVCRRYAHGKEEAMELLNSGMLKVFQKLETFKWEGSLEGWIKRLVFRVVADHFRSRRQPRTLEIADWDQPVSAGITHQLYAEDICRIIETLPGVSKEVFWLHAIEGYTHVEIGNRMGLSEGASRWHLNKARNLLKELLESRHLKNNRYAG